jgi:hypothetical protein
VPRTLIAVDHVLFDYHRTSVDSGEGLRFAPRVSYVTGIFASRIRVGLNSQDMTREEVLIPDKLCILGAGFSILRVEKGIRGGYKYDLLIVLALPASIDGLT